MIVISLFTGIGGFEIGFHDNNVEVTKHLEIDEKCCETINSNSKFYNKTDLKIAPIDITKLEPKNFYSKKVDYIVGGPPCQSFSAAGRRAGGVIGTSDIRGTLFWYYCKYVDYFKPKAFIFENVRGILSSKGGEDFNLICDSFSKIGYKLFWRLLNSSDYGVPQTRERLYLVGLRDDIDIKFKFPRPTHGPDSVSQMDYVTPFSVLSELYDRKEKELPYGGKYGHLLPEIPAGENYRFFTEEMGHPNPRFAWRSKFSGFLYKLPFDEPCRTIVANQSRYDGPFHWNNRKCTIDELKILQGFPQSYIINHSYGTSVKQIGNSVTPPVANYLCKAIMSQLESVEYNNLELVDSNFKLTYTRIRGLKSKKTTSKKKFNFGEIKQLNLFDVKRSNNYEYNKIEESGNFNKLIEIKDGTCNIDIYKKSKEIVYHKIEIQLYGNIQDHFDKIILKSYLNRKQILTVLWDEIHYIIKELSDYNSLLPLYGHFTEPYPKFKIIYNSKLNDSISKFQIYICNYKNISKNYELDWIKNYLEVPDPIKFIKKLRTIGYDIRTYNTNQNIPKNEFKICYPFTLPSYEKSYVVWRD